MFYIAYLLAFHELQPVLWNAMIFHTTNVLCSNISKTDWGRLKKSFFDMLDAQHLWTLHGAMVFTLNVSLHIQPIARNKQTCKCHCIDWYILNSKSPYFFLVGHALNRIFKLLIQSQDVGSDFLDLGTKGFLNSLFPWVTLLRAVLTSSSRCGIEASVLKLFAGDALIMYPA